MIRSRKSQNASVAPYTFDQSQKKGYKKTVRLMFLSASHEMYTASVNRLFFSVMRSPILSIGIQTVPILWI